MPPFRRGAEPPLLLELDLTAPVVEHEPDDPVGKLRSRGRTRLRAVLRTLYEAGRDPHVGGLIARVGGDALTLAQAQELHAAVTAFAASGKPAVAWATTFGESSNGSVGYLLATAFRDVWLQPTGELNLLGVLAEVTFLRGALDKLGVDPQLGRRHEYKNYADRFLQREYTPAHEEAAARLTASAWEQIVSAVAAGRGLEPAQVRAVADRGPLFADEALELGLIDHIGYRDEAYAATRRTLGGHAGEEAPLRFADRWRPDESPVRRARTALAHKKAKRVALVEAYGAIVVGRSRRTPLQGDVVGSDTVGAALRAAARDDQVAAIVFRVDSPGGSGVASDAIWREVACAREAGKPVIVSMGTVAGSGGYYVACGADAILAQPGTLTGSIGVVGGKFVATELTGKLGVNVDAVAAGRHARMYSAHDGFDPAARARLELWLDRIYDVFVQRVSDGRGMSIAAVQDVARGRVWTGADALDRGLVDRLGGLRDAVALARERAGLPDTAPVRPAVSVPMLARLKPAQSSEDPRAAAASVALTDGWDGFGALARALGLPAAGPLTMPVSRAG